MNGCGLEWRVEIQSLKEKPSKTMMILTYVQLGQLVYTKNKIRHSLYVKKGIKSLQIGKQGQAQNAENRNLPRNIMILELMS